MGRGRGNPALALALGALALAVVGCGAEDHANEPRPPQPIEVTVNISRDSVDISPEAIAFGGEQGAPVNQNAEVEEPELDSDRPQPVSFTISNTTAFDTALQIDGARTRSSGPIVANGTAEYQTNLDSGEYLIAAADIPAAAAARFSVGPERASSQNDLLLP